MAADPTLLDALMAFGLDPNSDEVDTPPPKRESPAAPASAIGAMSDLSLENTATSDPIVQSSRSASYDFISGRDLQRMSFPPLVWAADSLIPVGFSILVGAPKIGKSWAALQIASAVGMGEKVMGRFATKRGGVLDLALEDSPSRLQRRMNVQLGNQPWPDNVVFQCDWPRFNDGGLDMLHQFLEANPGTGLVIIDTLQRLRDTKGRKGNAYESDYDELAPVQRFAQRHGIAVLGVHHVRKSTGGEGSDFLEKVSGSNGVNGVADATIILERSRLQADGTMLVTGRDVEEAKHAVRFNEADKTWTVIGLAAELRRSQERTAIIDCIRDAERPLTAKELAAALGEKEANVRRTTQRMVKAGELTRRLGEQGRALFGVAEAN